jgi:hypothetical protein
MSEENLNQQADAAIEQALDVADILTDKQKALANLEFLQREYWRVRNRNNAQRYMRCPYCTEDKRMRNFPGSVKLCCVMFAKALKAILDRQDAVDRAQNPAKTIVRIAEMAAKN